MVPVSRCNLSLPPPFASRPRALNSHCVLDLRVPCWHLSKYGWPTWDELANKFGVLALTDASGGQPDSGCNAPADFAKRGWAVVEEVHANHTRPARTASSSSRMAQTKRRPSGPDTTRFPSSPGQAAPFRDDWPPLGSPPTRRGQARLTYTTASTSGPPRRLRLHRRQVTKDQVALHPGGRSTTWHSACREPWMALHPLPLQMCMRCDLAIVVPILWIQYEPCWSSSDPFKASSTCCLGFLRICLKVRPLIASLGQQEMRLLTSGKANRRPEEKGPES
jgi:hypothetical protein